MNAPYYADGPVTLWHGDCIDIMRTLPVESVHAVVTDPPYGLEFMGRDWDGSDGFRRSLNEADTGRGNVFGRTSATSPEYRTQNNPRRAAKPDDGADYRNPTSSRATAGMSHVGLGVREIPWPSHLGGLNPRCRTCNRWQRGASPCTCATPDFPNERLPRLHDFQAWCELWAAEALRVLKPGGHLLAFGGTRTHHRLASAIEDAGFEIRDSIAWLYGSGFPKSRNLDGEWQGWGTALKPAFEPIVVARKPMSTTVAANVARHGTGALNIDASRIGDGSSSQGPRIAELSAATRYTDRGAVNFAALPGPRGGSNTGRWPANVILDETQNFTEARYFYTAKASSEERPNVDGVQHPTVKPLDLMRWLVRLVTPPGGTVLEPFAGSGTTVEACIREGFNCIAIEREPTYLPLIEKRVRKSHPVGFDLDWDAS